MPTESTYEIVGSALSGKGMALLRELSQGTTIPAIILGDEAHLTDWMPFLRGVGLRLFKKMGPGPLVVRCDGGYSYGLGMRLPSAARELVIRDGLLALRWPAHPLWVDLRESDLPLISVEVPGATTAQEIRSRFGEQLSYVVEAGPTEFAAGPTIVHVKGRQYQVERAGALSSQRVGELALCRILFVCTGNTCRSPMAEALCAKMLADRLGCKVAELNQHGFCVQSAGLAAMMGQEASPEAVTIVAQEGASLTKHRSQSVNMDLLAWADHIFAMTSSHLYALLNVPVAGLPVPQLLSPEGEDVADPIGGALADYQECVNQIRTCLQKRLPELLES